MQNVCYAVKDEPLIKWDKKKIPNLHSFRICRKHNRLFIASDGCPVCKGRIAEEEYNPSRR